MRIRTAAALILKRILENREPLSLLLPEYSEKISPGSYPWLMAAVAGTLRHFSFISEAAEGLMRKRPQVGSPLSIFSFSREYMSFSS